MTLRVAWDKTHLKSIPRVISGLQDSGHNVETEISNIVRSYADKGIVLSDEEATSEYVANFSEEYLFNSEESINRLARENPNLFIRVYDWIKDTITKIGATKETKFLIDAQRKYEKALRTVKQNNNSNTIFFAVKDSSKDSIKTQIKNNIANIDTKKVVSVVEYEAQSGKTRTQMIEYYKKALKTKIMAPIQRQDFGDVRFEIKDISRGLEYLNTDGERAAMLTVPDVIKRGSAIFDRVNHKQRSYDTVTFAGLVTINGKKGVVGVVVKLGGKNRYKTHRVLMPDGTEYVFENKKTEHTDVGMISEDNRGRTISSVSVDSITQGAEKGNEKFSISYTDKNVPVVVVNDDIVRYSHNDKELIKNVKKAVSKFRTIPVHGQEIKILSSTQREITGSKSTQNLRHRDVQKYNDKMRTLAHPYDVMYASTNYINEEAKHLRKDNIVDFSRGEVLIDVSMVSSFYGLFG